MIVAKCYLVLLILTKKNVVYFQVVKGLLKFWPKTCSQKEVNLLMELQQQFSVG